MKILLTIAKIARKIAIKLFPPVPPFTRKLKLVSNILQPIAGALGRKGSALRHALSEESDHTRLSPITDYALGKGSGKTQKLGIASLNNIYRLPGLTPAM